MGNGKQHNIDANRNILYPTKHNNGHQNDNHNEYMDDNCLPVPKLSFNICSIVVFILSVSCFWITQYGDFYFDDSSAIVNNKDIRSNTPFSNMFFNDFWGTRLLSNTSHKSYRPLTVLTYRWNYILCGGLCPWGFHVVNIILYGICTVLLLRVFSILIGGLHFDEDDREVFAAPKASLLCASLFAVHPIHTESVAAIVGRADLICMIFYSISFIRYAKFSFQDSFMICSKLDLVLSMLMAAAAMFAKEQGITVLGVSAAFDFIMIAQICPVSFYDWMKGRKVKWKVNMSRFIQRIIFITLAIIILLLLRLNIMGLAPKFQYQDNPASFQSSFLIRVLNYNYLYSLNIWLLLNPWWLCFDWAMGCIPVITSFSDIRLLSPFIMLIVLALLTWKVLSNLKSYIGRCFTMSLAFLIIPFLPAMNIFFRVGFVIAERNLFISSVGFVLMVVIGFILLSSSENGKHLVRISTVFLILMFTARSIHRASDWLNEIQLFASGAKVCPLNAKVYYNIGKSNQDKGYEQVSIDAYLEAIRLWPDYDQPMNNLGNIYKDRKMFKEAEYYLGRAVNITPTFHTGWMNLGNVKLDLRKKEEAIYCFTQAVIHKKIYPDAYYNWGYLHLMYEEQNLALEKFNIATNQKVDHKLAWKNKIILLGNMGEANELLKAGKEAAVIFPSDDHLLHTIGNSLGIVGKLKDAEKFTKKALQINPTNYEAASILGVIYHHLNRLEEAEKYYRLALEGNPNNEGAKANYAKLKKTLEKDI